ncbi:helix-turn-helix domain-containing protein [Halomonas sp. TRM85114]|uniref:helix-turn-helix domain-containing protein n=1 Tax=Halomonas jincaotanensis TaxID=2810616 RepID=UPI001BD489D3|nr:helix-turn-helix domain-containing protein [Halomonas jincaotanensis]MBS9404202.1 helix-turn-helix domain-containing protein [Halomonas jincaotanensis]
MAQDRVEAVERALTVLEAFDSAQETLSLAELAQVTGYYKSTLLRLLGSLERFDYVKRGENGRWGLGHTPVRLARRHTPSRHLAARIQPLLDRLASESGETAALLEGRGRYIECRLAALPDASLLHDLRPGARWRRTHGHDPRSVVAGGVMVCRPLPTPPDEPPLWLSLSGPAGRLDPALAATRLDNALTTLEQPRDASMEATP